MTSRYKIALQVTVFGEGLGFWYQIAEADGIVIADSFPNTHYKTRQAAVNAACTQLNGFLEKLKMVPA